MSAAPIPLPSPDAPAPLVALEEVSLRLGGRTVLEGISTRLLSGQFLTLVGPNGAGKTSFVRLVLGLVRPSAGRVVRRPGLVAGYVPQRLPLDPALPLTVRRLMALTRPLDEATLRGALAEVEAEALVDRSVHALSGGELQRVLIARALARRPDLLVLDEPTQSLDFQGQIEVYRLVRAARARHGCAVLLVSHDLHVVMSATDQVLCLNRHLCCAGPPETVARHPSFRQLFGPQAAGELAIYRHRHADDPASRQ